MRFLKDHIIQNPCVFDSFSCKDDSSNDNSKLYKIPEKEPLDGSAVSTISCFQYEICNWLTLDLTLYCTGCRGNSSHYLNFLCGYNIIPQN